MSDITLLVLLSLSNGSKHGYAIQQDIATTSGIRLGPGSLYGAIARLEDLGLIRSMAAAGRRKPYEITDSGVGELRRRIEALRGLVQHADVRLATS